MTTLQSFFAGRTALRHDFLAQQDLLNANQVLVAEDWGSRRFWRIAPEVGATKILMESVPDAHPLTLPGHYIKDMIRIGQWMFENGIHVPEVYAADEDAGYILMEDFGSDSLPLQPEGYEDAGQVLIQLEEIYRDNPITLDPFEGSRIDIGKRRIIDWLIPLMRSSTISSQTGDEFLGIWNDFKATLPHIEQTFLHCDYAPQNIFWLPKEQGIARCGILDYQGALVGPLPYDWVNLLDDIRRDVPDDLKEHVLDTCIRQTRTAEQYEVFTSWYDALCINFLCRTSGQMIKLFQQKDDPRFLNYLPHVLNKLSSFSQRSDFKEIFYFLNDAGLQFDFNSNSVSQEQISRLVQPDAF